MSKFPIQVSGASIDKATEHLADAADVAIVSDKHVWSGATFDPGNDPARAARVVVVDADTPQAADERVRELLVSAGLEGFVVQVLES